MSVGSAVSCSYVGDAAAGIEHDGDGLGFYIFAANKCAEERDEAFGVGAGTGVGVNPIVATRKAAAGLVGRSDARLNIGFGVADANGLDFALADFMAGC